MTWLDDLQRRLAIAGARSLGQQFAGQVSRTIRGDSDDVWGTATAEPEDAVSAGDAPECAWCPVCRAIRRARGSSPDLAGRVGETADAMMSAAYDAVAAIDAAFSRMSGPPPASPPPPGGPASAPAEPKDRAASQERPAPPGPAASAGGEPHGTPPSPNGQQA